MSSGSGAGAGASGLDAELDRLSGPELVARLKTTCRRADYDAAARVLDARDRRLAAAEARVADSEAALGELKSGVAEVRAELQALRERYLALQAAGGGPAKGPSRGAIAASPAPRRGGPADVIDLCDSSGGEDDDDWEEGEFRPDAAGVSCKAKEPAPEGEQGRRRRAGGSCKRKQPVVSSDDDDDEDDKIPLSQLMKKRRGAEPAPNGEPKKGHGDVQANSAGPFGGRAPVNRGDPKASAGQRVGASQQLKVAAAVQGRGGIRQSGEGGGLSRSIPPPPPIDSAVGNRPQKNSSKADGAEDGATIGEQQRSASGPPFQVRTPTHADTARRIVGSARAGAETPKGHTDSALDATVGLVLNTIKEQGKTNGGMNKMKGLLEKNGFGEKACMIAKDIREQQKTQGQVLKVDVMQGTDGIGQQSGKLSTCRNRQISDEGRLRTSDKPVSASLQPNNQLTLHSDKMPAESSLSTSLQQNNQLILHSEQMPVESSLPSAVTRYWKSGSDVSTSCLVNKEICMQAACALRRQRKLTFQGGRSGGLSKSDVHRAAALAEFLLDGNLQGPLKRTDDELEKHDSGGADLLGRVALGFSEQLFSIYKNKEDPYFH
ncbi:unnamed protein product [Urochloa decumbens]|uniref:Uncharacterized protein n=1 Tax=Urochloa decumbens TaxID=240449 RepID=A0ABC8YTT9_9POAL